jgi:alpha-D-glucose phosphate-specific phosphoglucomutase
MMNKIIKFGTSGWRGLIAADFTFQNVRLASAGVAAYLKEELSKPDSALKDRKKVVIIGHDTRFLGREFAMTAAEVLTSHGINILLCDRDTPTPAISFSIRNLKALGGINITASHNPPEYQGFKYSNEKGAPATPEITKIIEQKIAALIEKRIGFSSSFPIIQKYKTFDPRPAYFNQIRKLICFDTIKKAKLSVAVDCMYGPGRGYLDVLLKEAGAKVTVFHDELNPLFGGHHPEPNAEGMREVSEFVASGGAKIGLGLDGDADRFGIVDENGQWLTPNQVLVLSLYHLKKNRGWEGAVVRSLPTTHQIDALAQWLGVKVHETPVGFKYIGALMESEPIIVGGEESGGLSVKGHVPEKDGILACLLMAELVATERMPLLKILKQIEKITGPFITTRINIKIDPAKKDEILKKLGSGIDKIGSSKVEKVVTIDGYKFILQGGEWVAFRPSGTEPLFRCYIEARSEHRLKRLESACRKLLKI